MWDQKNLPDFRLGGAGAVNMGHIPNSRAAFSVNPTANDTLGIGSTTFKFVASLGAAAAQVQVKIGASAAASLVNIIDAINGNKATVGSTWVEATTPFALAILADASTATQLRIRGAVQRGQAVLAQAFASTALTASITGGAAAWTNDNLNTIGKKPADVQEASGQFTITAAMITALATGIFIELPFTPTVYAFDVLTSTGTKKASASIPTDTFTVSGNALVLTSAGATHVVAGDILAFWAQQ
jgi:hypothetical protein